MSTQLRHSLLLLLTAFIWGVAFVAQSVGMDYVGPFTFTASRSLIGAVVLLPVIWFRTKKENGVKAEQKKGTAVDKQEKKNLLRGGIVCGVFLCIATNATDWSTVQYGRQVRICHSHVYRAGTGFGDFFSQGN